MSVLVLSVWLLAIFLFARIPDAPTPVSPDILGTITSNGDILVDNSHFVLEASDSPAVAAFLGGAVVLGLIGGLAMWFALSRFPLSSRSSYVALPIVTLIGATAVAGFDLRFSCQYPPMGASSDLSWALAATAASAFAASVIGAAANLGSSSLHSKNWIELTVMGVAAIPALLLLLPTLLRAFPSVIPC